MTVRYTSYEKLIVALGRFRLYQGLICLLYFCAFLATMPQLLYWVFVGDLPKCAEDGTPLNEDDMACEDPMSIAVEWKLFGDRSYLVTLINTIQFVGIGIGNFLIGFVADRFGRRTAMLIAAVGQLITVVGASQARTWQVFFAARFLVGVLTGCNMCAESAMTAENVLPEHRYFATTFIQGPLAVIIYAVLSMTVSTWRSLAYVGAGMIVPQIALLLLVSESPKWLIEKGRFKEAKKAIDWIAKWNGKQSEGDSNDIDRLFAQCRAEVEHKRDSTYQNLLDAESEAVKHTSAPERKNVDGKQTFYYWNLFYNCKASIRTLVYIYSNVVATLVSYGLAFNLINLQGQVAVNTIIDSLLRGTFVVAGFVLDTCWPAFGRKTLHRTGISGCLLSSLLLSIFYATDVGKYYPIILQVTAFFGAGCTEFLWAALNLYGNELFPTVLRAMGFGLASCVGRTGVMLATQVTYLFKIWQPLPYILFTVATGINLVLAVLVLPNTKNKPLADLGHGARVS